MKNKLIKNKFLKFSGTLIKKRMKLIKIIKIYLKIVIKIDLKKIMLL